MEKCSLQQTCLILKEQLKELNEKLKSMQVHIELLNRTLDYLITNYKNDKGSKINQLDKQ